MRDAACGQHAEALLDHVRLPAGTDRGVCKKRVARRDPEQRVQQARVPEQQLGRLHQALRDVGMERRQPPDQEAAFDEIGVGRGRLVVDAHAAAEFGRIPLLPVQRGEHAEEARCHLRRAGDPDRRQVSLREEAQVVGLPLRERRWPAHATVGESAHEPPALAHRRRPQLGAQEWGQLAHRHPAGERLTHAAHECRRHGAEQQEAPVAAPIGVDRTPEPGEERGKRLRLVEDGADPAGADAVPLDVEPDALGLLLEVEVLPPDRARQRGLAALARADDRHRRVAAEAVTQVSCGGSSKHSCRLPAIC